MAHQNQQDRDRQGQQNQKGGTQRPQEQQGGGQPQQGAGMDRDIERGREEQKTERRNQ